MSKIFLTALFLTLCLNLIGATVCPTGDMKVSSFPTLTGDDFAESSESYDAMYELKPGPTSGKFTLHGYRLTEVESGINAYFDIKQITIEGKQTWEVVFISRPGNCVIVRDRPYLLLYETSQNDFILMQTLNMATYLSVQANDNCSIARVRFTDSDQKVYQRSKQNTNIVFSQNSIFDSYFTYGVDTSRTLKKLSTDGMASINLNSSALQDTPVSILNRKDLNALILVTKSSLTDQYTVTIVNTSTDEQIYSRSWSKSSYSGNFIIDLSLEGNYFLIKDTNGYLLLLEISTSSQAEVSVLEITLQASDYTRYFAQNVVLSFASDAVVAYLDNKLNYFQSKDSILYYLTEISADLENQALKYEELSSADAPLIPTYIEPSQYKNCYPKSIGQETIKDQISSEQISVATDSQGRTVKCQPECLSCKGDGTCQVCSLGYSLSSTGNCVFCSGCRSCFPEAPEVCLNCFKPYVLNTVTKKCQKSTCTQLFCLSCFSNGTCQQCFKGYSIVNNVCVKCQDGCPICAVTGADKCDVSISACKSGYVYKPHTSNNVSYMCVQCATGCVSCSQTDISNCTSCNQQFYEALNTQTNVYRCLSCMTNCRTCTNSTTCNKCLSGYRLNSNGTKCIQNCDQNCLTCTENNTTNCLSCYAGTYLDNGKCLADLSCNPTKTCTACANGYALKNKQCLKCNYTDLNCVSCSASDLNVCLKCKYGFYMNQNRSCLKCSDACTGCLSDEACFSCNEGFYLARTADSVTGKCLACIDQCKTCNQFSYLCTICKQGYVLDGSKCISEIHVDYTLTINSPIEQIVTLARTFTAMLIEFADQNSVDSNDPLQLTSNDITINKLQSGSTLISGSISTFSQAQSDLILLKINQDLPGTELEKGYSIIKVEAKIIKPTTIDEITGSQNSSSQQSSLNISIILAVVIPLGLLCNYFFYLQ